MGLYGRLGHHLGERFGDEVMSRRDLKGLEPPAPLSGPSMENTESKSQVLCINRRRAPRKEALEAMIGSARRLEDSDLDQILGALDDLISIVKSNRLDSDAAYDALKRAAVWALKQSILDREARSLAITDELTGFFNRRGFLASAAQQLKLAYRDRQNVLLLFCDLDGLKKINDSFGHAEGDLALARTADALEETFRDSDVLARLGGDEFAILAWEARIPDLGTMLSRLEKRLRRANVEESRYQLSLSVGVARYDPQSPLSLGELMAQADANMYRHKNRRAFAGSATGS
jgi:diguanylate cyclase (GGDEF)-like protein